MPPRHERSPRVSPAADEAASAPRIIGGEFRGRRLDYLPDARTRPMKDRVRESLFDLLGTSVRDSLAIDLFAGTGALGFEAVSRGARRAIFCEIHFPTAATIRRSAATLGITDRVEVRSGDVLLWPRRMPPLPSTLPWVVFCSPPWSFFQDRRTDTMTLIDTLKAAAPPGSTVVVESDTSFDATFLPDAAAWTSRAMPPAVLHFHNG
jgi:16S rRNA (guanine966-N2)-methyltransferase